MTNIRKLPKLLLGKKILDNEILIQRGNYSEQEIKV